MLSGSPQLSAAPLDGARDREGGGVAVEGGWEGKGGGDRVALDSNMSEVSRYSCAPKQRGDRDGRQRRCSLREGGDVTRTDVADSLAGSLADTARL